MESFPLERAFQFLEPGPVILLTTNYKNEINVMTLSWHTVMDFTPKFGCLLGSWDYSYNALRKTKECVISIPTVDMMKKVVDIGNCSGRDVNKFERFKLTALEGECVQAPLIAQCLANIECKVIDTSLAKKYDLFVLEGVKAWFDSKRKEKRTFHANGDGTFVADGRTHNLRTRMTKWQSII